MNMETTTTVRRLTVDLPGDRQLHIALMDSGEGTPSDLVIAVGRKGARPLEALATGINLGPSALPELRDAFEATFAVERKIEDDQG